MFKCQEQNTKITLQSTIPGLNRPGSIIGLHAMTVTVDIVPFHLRHTCSIFVILMSQFYILSS